jgi:hypothetical protein
MTTSNQQIPSPSDLKQAVSSANAATCSNGADKLVGRSASLPGMKDRIREMCAFKPDLSKIPSSLQKPDRDFVEDSIVSNTVELQSLEYARDRVANDEWRGQIEMMIAMHSADLSTAFSIAQKIGLQPSLDLTKASVYPETPEYDLGKRTENMVEEYLVPLRSGQGVNFDLLSIDIIYDIHVVDVQGELAAERLVQDAELKAFARHSADVTQHHIMLMRDLRARLVDHYTPSAPEMQAPYQGPRGVR